jgi:hypothetical protein
MIAFAQWIAGIRGYATLPLFLDHVSRMHNGRLDPQSALATTFKERFQSARDGFVKFHPVTADDRSFRRITYKYAYSQVTALRRLWSQRRAAAGNMSLAEMGWENDNDLSGFRRSLQADFWIIFHVEGPRTWDDFNQLLQHYYPRSEVLSFADPRAPASIQRPRPQRRARLPRPVQPEHSHAISAGIAVDALLQLGSNGASGGNSEAPDAVLALQAQAAEPEEDSTAALANVLVERSESPDAVLALQAQAAEPEQDSTPALANVLVERSEAPDAVLALQAQPFEPEEDSTAALDNVLVERPDVPSCENSETPDAALALQAEAGEPEEDATAALANVLLERPDVTSCENSEMPDAALARCETSETPDAALALGAQADEAEDMDLERLEVIKDALLEDDSPEALAFRTDAAGAEDMQMERLEVIKDPSLQDDSVAAVTNFFVERPDVPATEDEDLLQDFETTDEGSDAVFIDLRLPTRRDQNALDAMIFNPPYGPHQEDNAAAGRGLEDVHPQGNEVEVKGNRHSDEGNTVKDDDPQGMELERPAHPHSEDKADEAMDFSLHVEALQDEDPDAMEVNVPGNPKYETEMPPGKKPRTVTWREYFASSFWLRKADASHSPEDTPLP